VKKLFAFGLVMLLALTLASCADNNDNAEIAKLNTEISRLNAEISRLNAEISRQNTESSKLNVEISRLQNELETLERENENQTTSATPSPSPTPSPTPTPEPEQSPEPVNEDIWAVKFYLDSARQPTNISYVGNEDDFVGIFSNSDTTDSRLDARILVDEDICIVLYEYGNDLLKNPSADNAVPYDIFITATDGASAEISGSMRPGGNRIFIDNEYHNVIFSALNGTGIIDFYIVRSDETTVNYSFQAPAANFADTYKLWRDN